MRTELQITRFINPIHKRFLFDVRDQILKDKNRRAVIKNTAKKIVKDEDVECINERKIGYKEKFAVFADVPDDYIDCTNVTGATKRIM